MTGENVTETEINEVVEPRSLGVVDERLPVK